MSNRIRITHETRASRDRKDFWKRLFVWAFIVVFAFSVAGGVIALAVVR
jgi:hypothetical protein